MGHRILPFNRRLRTSRTPRSSFAATCGISATQGRARYIAFDYGFLWEAVSFFAIGIKGLVINK